MPSVSTCENNVAKLKNQISSLNSEIEKLQNYIKICDSALSDINGSRK